MPLSGEQIRKLVDGGVVYPSAASAARALGVESSLVRNAIREGLIPDGVVEVGKYTKYTPDIIAEINRKVASARTYAEAVKVSGLPWGCLANLVKTKRVFVSAEPVHKTGNSVDTIRKRMLIAMDELLDECRLWGDGANEDAKG